MGRGGEALARPLRLAQRVAVVNVAFIAPSLDIGGVESQWRTLLPELHERGVAAYLVTLDGEGRAFSDLRAAGVPVRCVRPDGRFRSRDVVRAARVVAHCVPGVVVSNGYSGHVVGQVVSMWRKIDHVAAVHSMPEHPISVRQRLILRVIAPRVAASTTVTPAQLPFVRTLGFKTGNVRVIPNGVPRARPTRSRHAVREELGLASADFVALLVATLRPEKRPERFVAAVNDANQRDRRIRGLVAGGGPCLEVVRAHCAATRNTVRALGPRTEIAELIEASDVVCLSSDAEALPLAILEAMAYGRPVVAYSVGGINDAVIHDETGLVLPPGDVRAFSEALVELAGDPERARRMGVNAKERHARLFSVERMVEGYMKLFDNLATRRDDGPNV